MDYKSFSTGAISLLRCCAIWDLYILYYTTRHPFYYLITRGLYTYYLLNLTRLLLELQEEIKELIKLTKVINLTKCRFSIYRVVS
jgi:hypothetical protein